MGPFLAQDLSSEKNRLWKNFLIRFDSDNFWLKTSDNLHFKVRELTFVISEFWAILWCCIFFCTITQCSNNYLMVYAYLLVVLCYAYHQKKAPLYPPLKQCFRWNSFENKSNSLALQIPCKLWFDKMVGSFVSFHERIIPLVTILDSPDIPLRVK